MTFLNVANREEACQKSEADYSKYEVGLCRRLIAAKTIKRAMKAYLRNRPKAPKDDQFEQECSEMVSDMATRYYCTPGLSSFDVHFLLETVA